LIGEFRKLTAQFEKAVIGAFQPTKPDKIAQFRQLIDDSKATNLWNGIEDHGHNRILHLGLSVRPRLSYVYAALFV